MSGHGLITELDPVIIRRVVGLLPDEVMAAQLAATAAHMALIRGALTAIFWVHPPPHPHAVLGPFDEALDWALERLDEAGIGRPPRLRTAEGRGAARIMGSAQGARAEPRRASGGSRRG